MPTEAEKLRTFNRLLADAYDQGNYEEAYQYALLGMLSAREVYGGISASFGIMANNTAMLLRHLGRLQEAEPFSRLALEVSESAVGKKHPDYATNLNNLGLLLLEMGRYEEAERSLMAAVELRREILGKESEEYATSLNNLALVYRETGRYEDAVETLISSGTITRRLVGENSLPYAAIVTNLGAMYQNLGRFQEAESLLEQAVQIYAALLGRDHPDYINAVSNFGMILRELGKHRAAETNLHFALERRAVLLGKEHPDYALSLGNLAGLYLELGRIEQAVMLYQEAVEISGRALGEQHPRYAAALDNLALAYCNLGEYEQAEPLYRQALQLQEQVLGKNHPDYALSVSNLGYVCYYTQRYPEAIAFADEALRLLKPGHPDRTYAENNRASAYLALGQYDEAERTYRNRLRTSRKRFGEIHSDYVTALNNLAFLEAARGRYGEALGYLKRVVAIENRRMATIFTISSETQRLQFKIRLYTTYHAILALVIGRLSQQKSAVECAADLVLQRKALTAEPSLALRYAVLSDRYPDLQAEFQRLLTLKQQIPQAINTLEKYDLPDREREKWSQNLDRWQQEHEEIEQRLSRQVPEVGLQASLLGATWKSVAARLPAEGRLVEFVRYVSHDFYVGERGDRKTRWGKARFAAFVLTASPGRKVSVIDLGEEEAMEALTTAYLERLCDPAAVGRAYLGAEKEADRAALDAAREALASVLWKPLLPFLKGSAHTVICPDGVLHLLPFETLISPEEPLGKMRISYLNTGREALPVENVPGDVAPAEPFLVASPDYDLALPHSTDREQEAQNSSPQSGQEPYHALASSLVEGAILTRHFAAPLIQQEQATEGYLKAHCRRPRILHLSTHGKFEEVEEVVQRREMGRQEAPEQTAATDPLLRSWLVMAGANSWLRSRPVPDEVEDGKLTAADVSGLDLLGTELVVLSACQSGLGGVVPGEGIFGLRRAFLQAGAKTLLVSLWSIEGLSTAWLMDHFYRFLLREGQPRDQALRSAQQETRQAQASDVLDWLEGLALPLSESGARLPGARIKLWRSQLKRMTPSHRLFAHPYYWSGFLCIGETSPLIPDVSTRGVEEYGRGESGC